MAFSKSKRYPQDDQMVSEFMKVPDQPARLKILHQLAQEGTCNALKALNIIGFLSSFLQGLHISPDTAFQE